MSEKAKKQVVSTHCLTHLISLEKVRSKLKSNGKRLILERTRSRTVVGKCKVFIVTKLF